MMEMILDIITLPVDCIFWLFAALCCWPMKAKDRSFARDNFPTTILWQDIPHICRGLICLAVYCLIFKNI